MKQTWSLPFDYELARAQGYEGTEVEAYIDLGVHLSDRGDSEGGILALKRSIELGAEGRAWYHLGDILGRQKQWEQAVDAFQQATQFSPNHCATALKLGQALQSAGRYSEAIEALTRAHVLNPKSIVPLVHRAESRARLGEIGAAIEDLEAVIEREPTAKRIRELLNRLRDDDSGPPSAS